MIEVSGGLLLFCSTARGFKQKGILTGWRLVGYRSGPWYFRKENRAIFCSCAILNFDVSYPVVQKSSSGKPYGHSDSPHISSFRLLDHPNTP